MSLRFPEISRRACLGVAAGSLLTSFVRAACPCDSDAKEPEAKSPTTAPSVLKLTADPNNLPFSNRKFEGFEDKIVSIIADDLGFKLQYRWLPQRLGFFREALKTGDSNLVMAAPAGFEKAAVTRPYYRSSYVFVYRKDTKKEFRSFDDDALRSAKIGIPLSGGANTPPAYALAKRKLIDNVTGFPVFDETDGKPGEKIIAAVAEGTIDVAIAWGPSAGYFAHRQKVPLEVTPVTPSEEHYGDVSMEFAFDICMALRRSDKEVKVKIDKAIVRRQRDIDKVLDQFSVPRLAMT